MTRSDEPKNTQQNCFTYNTVNVLFAYVGCFPSLPPKLSPEIMTHRVQGVTDSMRLMTSSIYDIV